MLIHNKDDIEFVTEFPCFFWTPYMLKSMFRFQEKPEPKDYYLSDRRIQLLGFINGTM